jgi:hypothetical protein
MAGVHLEESCILEDPFSNFLSCYRPVLKFCHVFLPLLYVSDGTTSKYTKIASFQIHI